MTQRLTVCASGQVGKHGLCLGAEKTRSEFPLQIRLSSTHDRNSQELQMPGDGLRLQRRTNIHNSPHPLLASS